MDKPFITPEEEYKRHPNLKKEDVKYLLEWASKQPHLPRISDSQMIQFLRCVKYSIEKSKSVCDSFYTLRTHTPEFFQNRDCKSNELQTNLKNSYYFFTSEIDPRNDRLIIGGRLADPDPDRYNFSAIMKHTFLIVESYVMQYGTVNDSIAVIDATHFGMGHLIKTNIVSVKKFIYYIQEGVSINISSIHIINAGPAMESLLNMVRPFFSKELAAKLHVHGTDLTNFFKTVPQKHMPEVYGGNLGSLGDLRKPVEDLLLRSRDVFIKQDPSQVVDESKRPGKSKNEADIFGVEGSFKKLAID